QARAQLVVDGGPAVMIDLPPAGQARSYFIDLPSVPEQHVHIRLRTAQALSLDDEAWLVRLHSSPVVEARGVVPAAVMRMIEVYTQQRPPARGAAQVMVGTRSTPPTGAGVIIADAFPSRLAAGPIDVRTHVITRSADWQGVILAGTG